MNKKRTTGLRLKRTRMAGWDQGSLTPPISMGNRKARMAKASRTDPVKSTRLILLFLLDVSSTPSEEDAVEVEELGR